MKLNRILIAASFAAAISSAFAAKPLVVAHRGYWDTPGSSQNSIRSLVKADSIGAWGSEFDVWMTADSVVVLNHDGVINGVVVETSPAEKVCAQKLSNGENPPTLDDFLNVAKDLKISLVCEIKPHTNLAQEREAIKRTLELVRKYGLENRMTYITFSRNAFSTLLRQVPDGTPVQYLTGDYIPEQVAFMKGAGIDYSMNVMRKHPEWLQRAHDLGLVVNVWTVDKDEDLRDFISQGADIITTNRPEELQNLLK